LGVDAQGGNSGVGAFVNALGLEAAAAPGSASERPVPKYQPGALTALDSIVTLRC
jgi:hypothetical protein